MVGAVQKLAVKEALSFWYMQMNQLLYDLLNFVPFSGYLVSPLFLLSWG